MKKISTGVIYLVVVLTVVKRHRKNVRQFVLRHTKHVTIKVESLDRSVEREKEREAIAHAKVKKGVTKIRGASNFLGNKR